MKTCVAIELAERYGGNTTLGDLVRKIQGNKIYKCPKCNGIGKINRQIYSGTGWDYEPKCKKVTCDLCHGEGYTEHEYKPRMVQDGWE